MKNIKVRTLGDDEMFVNWDNVNYVKDSTNHFGQSYREIVFCNGNTVATSETIEELERKLSEKGQK